MPWRFCVWSSSHLEASNKPCRKASKDKIRQGSGRRALQPEHPPAEAAEGLPAPLEHILAEVFGCYEARSPEKLMTLLLRRFREDATFVDPTLVSRPRRDVALTFYSLQHLFSSVSITDISRPVLHCVPQQSGPSLLQVAVTSRQQYNFARTTHISQQVLPEGTCLETTTRLLLDPATGQVVHHEDSWANKPTLPLPWAWRRFNAVCINGVYRLLGWGRVLQAAEAACSTGSGRWGEE